MFMNPNQIETIRNAPAHSWAFEGAYRAFLALERVVKTQKIEEGRNSSPEQQLYNKVSGLLDERFPGVDLMAALGIAEEECECGRLDCPQCGEEDPPGWNDEAHQIFANW